MSTCRCPSSEEVRAESARTSWFRIKASRDPLDSACGDAQEREATLLTWPRRERTTALLATSHNCISAQCVPTARVLPAPQRSEVMMLPLPTVSTSLCVAPVVAFHKNTDCPSATARTLEGLQSSRLR